MTWRSVFLSIVLLVMVGLAALWLLLNAVLIRFVHRDFPGGTLTLAGHAPIELDKGTGSQHFLRWIDQDSSILLKCGSGAAATEERMGYFTQSLAHYVLLEVEGCTVKRLDILYFP